MRSFLLVAEKKIIGAGIDFGSGNISLKRCPRRDNVWEIFENNSIEDVCFYLAEALSVKEVKPVWIIDCTDFPFNDYEITFSVEKVQS